MILSHRPLFYRRRPVSSLPPGDRLMSGPRPACFVSEDWRDGARLWQAVCFLREQLMPAAAQLVPVVHRRDPRARVATVTRLAARRAGHNTFAGTTSVCLLVSLVIRG